MSCCVPSFMRRVTHLPLFGRESCSAVADESAAAAEPTDMVVCEQAVSGSMLSSRVMSLWFTLCILWILYSQWLFSYFPHGAYGASVEATSALVVRYSFFLDVVEV